MTVRRASEDDREAIRVLWEEFEAEVPAPPGDDETFEEDWVDVAVDLERGAVYLAEDDEGPLGIVRLSAAQRDLVTITHAHVSERGRRGGVLKALLAAALADVKTQGATYVGLEVLETNTTARQVWARLGFEDVKRVMATSFDRLEERLQDRSPGTHRATTHVQSDDELSVHRAVAQFVPRLESARVDASESWIRVVDAVFDEDREAHGRFAKELSDRLGAVTVALALEGEVVRFRLYERGRMVDEYLSVPNYYGELSKGDELALAANPTLIARLTGADKEDVRRVARTADSPGELPAAPELYDQIARLIGVDG